MPGLRTRILAGDPEAPTAPATVELGPIVAGYPLRQATLVSNLSHRGHHMFGSKAEDYLDRQALPSVGR
jgi:hypothetical protein